MRTKRRRPSPPAEARAGPLRVLFVEHALADVELARRELTKAGFALSVDVVQTPEEFAERLRAGSYDIVLADYRLPGWTGMDALALMRQGGLDLPLILVSGSLGEEQAVECVKQGASDYVLKDHLVRLPMVVRRALAEKAAHDERARAEEALRASERKFRQFIEAAPDAVVGVGSDGRIVLVNAQAETLFGYRREELLGQPIDLLVPERLREAHTEHRERFQETPRVRAMGGGLGLRGRRKDGTEFPAEISLSPVDTPDGLLVIAITRDLTERTRAQDELRAAQAVALEQARQLSSIYDTVADVVFQLAVEKGGRYRFTSVNQAFCSVTGLRYDQVVGKRVDEIIPQPSLTVVMEKYAEAIREKRAVRWEETSDYPTGRLTGEVTVAPVIDDAGNCTDLVGAVHDITERKRAEHELRAAQARLQQVLAASGAVIYANAIAGQGFIPVWVSESLSPITGYEREETLSPTWWTENLHPDDRKGVLAQMPDLVTKGRLALEYRFRRKDGTYRWIRDQSRVLGDREQGEVVGVWLDITERRQLEEQFRQAQKMEAVGRLAGGVAHDFNNILTAIMNYGDLLLEELPQDSPLKQDVEEIRKAATRASALTRQLLAFSRKQILETRVLDFNALAADMDKLLRRLLGEDIDLVTKLDPALGRVRADPGQLEQVIVNLAVNARDAMPQGGKLTIETRNAELDEAYAEAHVPVKPGPYVMVAVSDTGIGMSEEIKAHIFEPFFTTKEKGQGTGLGLATVYGIVKQSNGYVWCYSEPGHGTSFKIYLPRVDAPVEQIAPRPAGAPAGGSETVLLVEDEEPVRTVARRVLEAHGYTVLEAPDGNAALTLARRHAGPLHLLITDVVLPGMGGRKLADALVGLRPELKVLYMSGYTDDAIVHRGVLEPGTPFLHKPFSPEGLARKAREVLDGTLRRP